jgi:hypothetical protein
MIGIDTMENNTAIESKDTKEGLGETALSVVNKAFTKETWGTLGIQT